MGKKQRYDDQFRANAVLLLQGQGYPTKLGALKSVSQHLNVPERTLQRWANGDSNPPPDNIVAQNKEQLMAELKSVAAKLISAIPDKIDDAPLSAVMTGLGITIDKLQLLEGNPTANISVTWEQIFGSHQDNDDPYA